MTAYDLILCNKTHSLIGFQPGPNLILFSPRLKEREGKAVFPLTKGYISHLLSYATSIIYIRILSLNTGENNVA